MLIISKRIRDGVILTKIFDPLGAKDSAYNASENFKFSEFGHHLEFCQKSKVLIIKKTVTNRAISNKFWILWVL